MIEHNSYEKELAPCPFCGSSDVYIEELEGDELVVECSECHAGMSGDSCDWANTKQELIEKWNRRPPESTELNKLMDMVNERDSLLSQVSNELFHWNALALSRVDIITLMEAQRKKSVTESTESTGEYRGEQKKTEARQ